MRSLFDHFKINEKFVRLVEQTSGRTEFSSPFACNKYKTEYNILQLQFEWMRKTIVLGKCNSALLV